ncbi:MAG TPA: cobalamin-independent methionine synthase II family protein [Bryobacteraceae bacterium]|nr:cobalamin-independent methionine synthase II family protein [Bryobacteraceae bacterium]
MTSAFIVRAVGIHSIVDCGAGWQPRDNLASPVNGRIKTTVVGSYPVLPWMIGSPSRPVLRDAIMAVLKTQELAGLDLVTDGELTRFDPSNPAANGMVDYFVSRMSGIRNTFAPGDFDRFRMDRASGYRLLTPGVVIGKVGEGSLNLLQDYEFVSGLTKSPLKFTCTGPHMLARLLTNCFYKDTAGLAMDIAEVLRGQLELLEADTVQIDEASIVGFPEDSAWASEAINHVLSGVLNETAVHICFGNYGGQPMLRGFWRDLVPFLNSLRADHLVLEFARRGYDELEVLRDLDPKIGLGIGVIDIKDNEVESPELIASRIEKIVNTLGAGRLRYIHPDCGFWMLQRSVVDRKMRALVEGRDLFEGRL